MGTLDYTDDFKLKIFSVIKFLFQFQLICVSNIYQTHLVIEIIRFFHKYIHKMIYILPNKKR